MHIHLTDTNGLRVAVAIDKIAVFRERDAPTGDYRGSRLTVGDEVVTVLESYEEIQRKIVALRNWVNTTRPRKVMAMPLVDDLEV